MRNSIIFSNFAVDLCICTRFIAKSGAKVVIFSEKDKYFLKKIVSHIILLCMLLFSGMTYAEVGHHFGVDIYGGEWSLWEPRVPQNNFSLGAAGSAGFAYELQAGERRGDTFFLLHLGVSAQAGMSFFASNHEYKLLNQTDPNETPFTYVYKVSNRRDRYNKLTIQMPVLMGVQYKRFYMLAGMKFGYNAVGTYWSDAQLTTYGEYADGHKEENKKEWQFYKEPIALHRDAKLDSLNPINPICIDASLEIGIQLSDGNSRRRSSRSSSNLAKYRLALYIDFGLTHFKQWPNKNKNALYEALFSYKTAYSPDMVTYNSKGVATGPTLMDIMSTADFVPKELRYDEKSNPAGIIHEGDYLGRNIMAGIKFTVLFPTGRARYRYTRVNRYYYR